jgi:hypothetical protein
MPSGGGKNAFEAFINIEVHEFVEHRGSWNITAPFLVDTGSPWTVFPRALGSELFRGKSLRPAETIKGLIGKEEILVEYYSAELYIPALGKDALRTLSFGAIEIAVASVWNHRLPPNRPPCFAVLGLDAIRRLHLFSDGKYVYFRPPQR